MPSREYICSYPDCHRTATVTVSIKKPAYAFFRFCCEEHAGLFLLRQAWTDKTPKSFATKLKNDISKSL